MPTYHYAAMTSTGEEVVNVVDAEDMQAARRLLSERGLFITKLVESSESADEELVDSDEADNPAKSLADFGWFVQPTDDGGVRLRRSSLWRTSMVGCSTVIVVLFASVASVMFFMVKRVLPGPAVEGVWRIPILLIWLIFVGGFACFGASLMWRVLRLALHREEWEAMPNRLIVRRGLVGFLRGSELSHCELMLEPHFERNQSGRQWRLAAVCNSEKHYLLRGQAVPIGSRSAADVQAEADAIASLLASHTGWHVSRSEITVDGQAKPPADSNEEELLAALRTHGYVAEVDEQSRLTIRPPKLWQRTGGLVLLAMGSGWLCLMAHALNSFMSDTDAQQDAVLQIGFWVLMTPMVMVGIGLCALGIAVFFGRERWTVDRNLLLVHSRLFGWKSEHEFVNARWKLAQVLCTSRKGRSYTVWRLELENTSSESLKVLHVNRDDDIPRLLGTLLSQRTGWSLRDENQIESDSM